MTKQISIRIDEDLVDALDQVIEKEGLGRSEAVREAIQLWLKQYRVAEQVRCHREGYERRPVAAGEFEPVLGAQQWPK
jgi:metal-responsive CopG/Arc/MetJ family transcriptional regulator